MKILLTGTIHSFADKKGTVMLESLRKAKDGPVTETFFLKFHNDEAYQTFKGRYALGDGVQVIGLLRQVQIPILDKVTKQPIQGTSGRDLHNGLLSVEVKEHKPTQRDEFDTLYVHGLVTVASRQELAKSAGGVSYLKSRVVYKHYKRTGEEEAQADFYNMIAFGGQAESLDNLEKGYRLVIDYAVPSLDTYDVRDITHSDGTAISRNGLELVLREFSFLPRSAQTGDLGPATPTPRATDLVPEEIPF